jgi:hypothetical protein
MVNIPLAGLEVLSYSPSISVDLLTIFHFPVSSRRSQAN